jgi:hypothetical protein
MAFSPAGPEGAQYGGISGEASYVAGSGGDPWVADFVSMGLVVLAESQPTKPTSSVHIIATAVPTSVRELAGCPYPRYLIVDGHPAALAAAEATPEPVPNGEPEPEPASPVAEAKTETATLLIVGGVVLLLGASFCALVTRR